MSREESKGVEGCKSSPRTCLPRWDYGSAALRNGVTLGWSFEVVIINYLCVRCGKASALLPSKGRGHRNEPLDWTSKYTFGSGRGMRAISGYYNACETNHIIKFID